MLAISEENVKKYQFQYYILKPEKSSYQKWIVAVKNQAIRYVIQWILKLKFNKVSQS